MPTASEIFTDLRAAANTVLRDLRFHVPLVLLLALPVGALAVTAAAVRGMILAPLPYKSPDELVLVSNRFGHDRQQRGVASAPELLDYRGRLGSLADLAAVNSFSAALTGDGGPPQQLQVGVSSGNLFEMLGVDALYGSVYTATDDTPLDTRDSANSSVLVLSHRLWRSRYGGDPGVVGRLVRVGGTPMRIIAVLPAEFRLRLPPGGMTVSLDAWTPLRINYLTAPREGRYLTLIGRLAPGRTLARLSTDAAAAARELRERFSDYERAGLSIGVEPLHAASVEHLRPISLVLVSAATIVLVLACINSAGMLLARLVGRGRELAIRSAVGAGRGRLLRHLAGEIALVAAIATSIGIGVGLGVVGFLRHAAFNPDLEALVLPLDAATLGGALALFLFIAATLAALGAIPGLRATCALAEGPPHRRGTAGMNRGWRRLRGALVAGQVALSLLLVVGAGLLLRSSLALRDVPLGFEPDRVMTFRISLPFSRYPDPRLWVRRYEELMEELATLPGVESVGAVDRLPASGGIATAPYAVLPSAGAEWGATSAVYQTASAGYFGAMRIPVLAGRWFTDEDREGVHRVVVVDQAFARKVWRGSPLGSRLEVQVEDFSSGYRVERVQAEVVGVVANVPHDRPDRAHVGTIYLPLAQQAAWSVALALRTRIPPETIMEPARRIIARLDPELPAYDARSMADVVSATFALTDLALSLVAAFAVLALAVSAAGLFGVIAYIVRATGGDQAVRLACGASPRRLLGAQLLTGAALAVAGIVGGLALALPATQLLDELLVEVRASDPGTLAAASGLVFAVATLSTLAAAIGVLRIDPVRLLRTPS